MMSIQLVDNIVLRIAAAIAVIVALRHLPSMLRTLSGACWALAAALEAGARVFRDSYVKFRARALASRQLDGPRPAVARELDLQLQPARARAAAGSAP